MRLRITWKKTLALLLTTGALFLFGLWIRQRGGPDYYGIPEALLPENTAALATWRSFSTFLDKLENLQAVKLMEQDDNLAALLLTDSRWQKMEKEKDKARYKIVSGLARDFVNKWLGQEVSLAVIPPIADAIPPTSSTLSTDSLPAQTSGLILIARTKVGFEENLAELTAQLYPGLLTESQVYKGHRIYRYNPAGEGRRAFSYCRFGKTIIISLRSTDWHWIQRVIDRRLSAQSDDAKVVTLEHNDAFRNSTARRQPVPGGLALFVNPKTLPAAMENFPGKAAEGERWGFWVNYMKAKLKDVEWGTLNLKLDKGLQGDSFWKVTGAQKLNGNTGSKALEAVRDLPSSTSLLLTVESPRFRQFAQELYGQMAASDEYAKKTRKFEKSWRKDWKVDWRDDFMKPIGSHLGVAVTNFSNGLFFPVPIGRAWFECVTPQEALRVESALVERYSGNTMATKMGELTLQNSGSQVAFLLNDAIGVSLNAGLKKRLFDHPMVAEVWQKDKPSPTFCFFVNFETCHVQLEQMHAMASLWSKDVREKFQGWETTLAALKYVHALRITAEPVEGGVEIKLLVPVE